VEYLFDHKEARQPAYRQIAEALRNEILSGKLAPGTRLPSTDQLAATWKSSVFTTHKALVALVKEGWVERLHGAGTYVADPRNRFFCAGIYHGADICSNKHFPFIRSVHESLLEQFGRMGKEVQVFIDSRPAKNQEKVLPALADSVLKRRIQCLVAPSINVNSLPALAKLALPSAFTAYEGVSNRINFNPESFVRESVRHLAAQGCRSVGLITPDLPLKNKDAVYENLFFHSFYQALRKEKMVTRDEWVRAPSQWVAHHERHGYQEFQELWKLREKPDGLIVFPDTVAIGVIAAILEIGVRVVPSRVKFVFHRNAHSKCLCPFPVTWAISDEDRLAAGLIELIQMQFKGKKTSPILLPYVFRKTDRLI
jgi:DNA-binding LacI/PurR family transcriptional regulator